MSAERQRKNFESALEARVKSRTKELETRNGYLEHTNKELKKEVFDYHQRNQKLTTLTEERDHLLGVIDTLHSDNASVVKENQIAMLQAQEKMASLASTFHQMKCENLALLEQLHILQNSLNESTAGIQLEHLRMEHENLQKLYDQLKEQRESILKAYEADMRKWKNFKHLVFKRKGDKLQYLQALVDFYEGAQYKKVTSLTDVFSDPAEKENDDSGTRRDAGNNEPHDQDSQTQAWTYRDTPKSRRLLSPLTTPLQPKQNAATPRTSSPRKRPPTPSTSSPSLKRNRLRRPSLSPMKRKGSSCCSQDSKTNSNSMSVRNDLVVPPSPELEQHIEDPLTTLLALNRGQVPKELEPTPVTRSLPSPGPSISKSKKTSVDTTINALFEINPVVNNGLRHQFDEVVRDASKRKGLHATDCECCRDYYDAVGAMPPVLQRPLWTSPKRKVDAAQAHDPNIVPSSSPDHVKQHRQDVSRHRQQWTRAATPPDFWEIGFPDTQQVEDINERARDIHRKKRQRVEEEAKRPNGKYRKREGRK